MIYTVGYGFRSLPSFLYLLKPHGITKVIDVRSKPFPGKSLPQFGRAELEKTLPAEGISYVWLGWFLGGQPSGDEFYDDKGHVRYDRLAASPGFKQGLARLLVEKHGHSIVLLCAEKDPASCHRHNLIARVLRGVNEPVSHILAGGNTIDADVFFREEEAAAPPDAQISLFQPTPTKPAWISKNPVKGKARSQREAAGSNIPKAKKKAKTRA